MQSKKLPSKSQIRAEIDAKVLKYMRSAPAVRRITEVSKAIGIPIPAANVSLRRLLSGGDLVRSSAPKRGRDGHIHGQVPLYKAQPSMGVMAGPHWISPRPPKFPAACIVGARIYRQGRLCHE